jgi:hypothetical protein
MNDDDDDAMMTVVAFREPHSVHLHASLGGLPPIDVAIARLSAHFAAGHFAHNQRAPRRRDDALLRGIIRNVDDVDAILTRVSPDLDLDSVVESSESDTRNNTAAVTSLDNDAWIADLAQLLVRRDAPDRAPSFRAPHVVAALRNAFDRRLVEHRRVVSSDGVDVFLRAQTRLDPAFVDRLNRAVQRASAGRCAVHLMPHSVGWSPDLPDSVLLRLAVSAELALIELSPRAGAQLAVTSTLVIEPAAAALGDEPITVNILHEHVPTSPSAAASSSSSSSSAPSKRKRSKKQKGSGTSDAESTESKGRTCVVQ